MKYILFRAGTCIMLGFFSLCAHAQIEIPKDDNYHLLEEIGINFGIVIFENDGGSTFNIEGAHFFMPNYGLRSGVTLYSGMNQTSWGAKIPILFAARSKSDNYYGYEADYNDSYTQVLANTILSALPFKVEGNIGPAFGYLQPENASKNMSVEEKRKENEYFLDKKFMMTIDANIRISFSISHVSLNFGGGASYFITKNYRFYTNNFKGEDDGKIARWMGNLNAGLSYCF